MAMGTTEMAMDDVPMMEILSRLPMKPLVRLKCVSKHWYALITSFENQNKVLLKRQVMKESGEIETRFSILKHPFFTAGGDDEEEESYLEGPEFQHCLTHGSSHGIVCFSTNLTDVFLYNPATRELRKLPPSVLISRNWNSFSFQGVNSGPLCFHGLYPGRLSPQGLYCGPFYLSSQGVHSNSKGVGFGYDPKSRDLKVVRIVEYYTHTQDVSRPPRAEVYDLGKDGWREIKTPIPSYPVQLSSFDIYHQGCYYWWATSFHAPQVILWFDFTKEVFGIVSMPEDLYYRKLFSSLAVLNESIVFFNYPCEGNEKSFHVWKMVKDDDLHHGREVVSWTKLFTIGPLLGVHRPLAFVSCDELLMVDNEEQLTLCNIFNPQHCRRLPLKGITTSFQASLFVKTTLCLSQGRRST